MINKTTQTIMLRNLTLLTISVLLFCSAQCSREETPAPNNGGIQPEWEFRIPKFVNYDGLQYIYKYKNTLIAHNSFYNTDFHEDNRLCAINEDTKKIEWYFPSDTHQRYDYMFNSPAHQYKNKLIFEYEDQKEKENGLNIVCLDLDTHEVIWHFDHVIRGWDIMAAVENICYIAGGSDSRQVYRVNLDTFEEELFYETSDTHINSIIMTHDEKGVVIFHTQRRENDIVSYASMIDISTRQAVNTINITPEEANTFFATKGIERNGRLVISQDQNTICFDFKTGNKLWESYDYNMFMVQEWELVGNIFLQCGMSEITAYDFDTGKILYKLGLHSPYSTIHGKYLYAVYRDLLVIDIATGKTVASIKCPYDISQNFFGSFPTIIDDKLYMMSYNYLFRFPAYPWN